MSDTNTPNESVSAPLATRDPRRALPSVAALIDAAQTAGFVEEYGLELVTVQVRNLLRGLREDPSLTEASAEPPLLLSELGASLLATQHPIRRVINATGVFLHTNLGRAPLPQEVIELLGPLLDAGCDLEVDLESGQRGDRNQRVNRALCELTGAPQALVVNNNAAALVLVLRTLARGKQVVVSRGELVEIGGSFRIPDILASSGSRLVEVGSTNRTRIEDYAAAITEDTGLLLKVYPSNYRIRGFTSEASIPELVALARERSVPLLVDEGSGLLRPRSEPVFNDHGSIATLLKDGCDLVCGSGDKVLGGSQAGLLLGREDLVTACHRNPLYRALRPSRLVLVTLGGVLERHRRGQSLPLDQLFVDEAQHRVRLSRVVKGLRDRLQTGSAEEVGIRIVEGSAYVGGGSAPDSRIPGPVLAIGVLQAVTDRLRTGATPVVGRMRNQELVLDLRTVAPRDDSRLVEAVLQAIEPAADSESV